jgi:hypothetical protein
MCLIVNLFCQLIEAANNGKPYQEALEDVEASAYTFDYYAKLAEELDAKQMQPVQVPLIALCISLVSKYQNVMFCRFRILDLLRICATSLVVSPHTSLHSTILC